MKRILLTAVATILLGVSLNALCAKGGSAGGAGQHMSPKGAANTNGPNAADRDKGQDRAEDRRSAQGNKHENATKHKHGKHQGKAKDKGKDKNEKNTK